MARYIAIGIWTCIGTTVLFFIVSAAHGFDSDAQNTFESGEEVANRQPGLGVRVRLSNRRRSGIAVKYKKVSVMQSGMEKADVFEVSDMRQNKTRRIKTKTSHRHTMIYKPTKKRITSPKKGSFTSSAASTKSPEVKEEEPPDSSRRTKSWNQVQPVADIIDSFIRPTKRSRVHLNNRKQTPTEDTVSTTPTSKVTKDPLRPISRVRSGAVTTTTSRSTTTKFLRLDRKPNRWQDNLSNENNRQQPSKEKDSEISVTSTTELTTFTPKILTHPQKEVFRVTPETVPETMDFPETAEIEHLKEESSIQKVAAKPDKIAYFYTNDPATNTKSEALNSQERNVRPRIHLPKKEAQPARYKIQRPTQEPILLQTKEQREQQQKEASDKRRAEESIQLAKTLQRVLQSDSNAQPQSETNEDTEKWNEEYEAEKNQQLERLRQSKTPDAIQFGDELPKARKIPSRSDYSNSPVRNSVRVSGDSADADQPPASGFGQRLPSSGQYNSPQVDDSRPSYLEFESSYPSPGRPEQQRYAISPSSTSETPPNLAWVRQRNPGVVYRTTSRPDLNTDNHRIPTILYTTIRPDSNEERRPIYKTTPPPIYGEEKYRRPELIYTPPEKEFQPPSAYLAGHGTYPRLRIVHQPTSSSVPSPPVTYEPPHLEYMPPAASPPPRIYVPPVEDYKPPSTTAVLLHGRRQEEETPSASHPARLETARMAEEMRKLEEINSYTRLVSVGHPSVKELPYPPQWNRPAESSRPAQSIELFITENPYIRTYERTHGIREKGEIIEKPKHGNYPLQPITQKSHAVEGTFIVNNRGTQTNEKIQTSYDRSSLIVGKPYFQNDEVPVKIIPYPSYRPSYDTEVSEKPYSPNNYADVNTERRYPDSIPLSISGQQVHQSYQPNQVYKSYQHNQPNTYEPQQPDESFQSKPKEPRLLPHPPSVMEKPYVVSWPVRDLEVADYRHENIIPVSEQPPYKPCDLPEIAALRTEKPPKETHYIVSERPATVSVRPYGLASAESGISENVYKPPGYRSQPRSFAFEPRTNPNQLVDKYQQNNRDALEQRPQYQSVQQSNIPASYLPVGPVRAYQVTQAVYPSPPPRFFQLPAPLPNPFENQFGSPSSQPPPPLPSSHSALSPPQSQSSSTTSDSFASHKLPPGDTWSVNPLFPDQRQFPSSRPFTSSIQPVKLEEPVASESIIRYQPASVYRETQRLNRSLTDHSTLSYEEQDQPADGRSTIRETIRIESIEEPTYHQTYQTYNDRTELREMLNEQQNESLHNQPEDPPYLQPPPGYEQRVIQNGRIHQFRDDPTDHKSSSEGDFSGVKGIPGVDYPILHTIPTDLKFKCELVDSIETHHPAYYADPYTRCQVFHVCQASRAKNSFLCPNGTIFNQKVRVCDWWHNVQCDESSAYYDVNNDNYQLKHSIF